MSTTSQVLLALGLFTALCGSPSGGYAESAPGECRSASCAASQAVCQKQGCQKQGCEKQGCEKQYCKHGGEKSAREANGVDSRAQLRSENMPHGLESPKNPVQRDLQHDLQRDLPDQSALPTESALKKEFGRHGQSAFAREKILR